jgi:hypothetical protein
VLLLALLALLNLCFFGLAERLAAERVSGSQSRLVEAEGSCVPGRVHHGVHNAAGKIVGKRTERPRHRIAERSTDEASNRALLRLLLLDLSGGNELALRPAKLHLLVSLVLLKHLLNAITAHWRSF